MSAARKRGPQARKYTDLELNGLVAEALVAGRVNWCRARLIHALNGAAKQGVLREVLDELLPDIGEQVAELLAEAMRRNGWT